MGKFILFIVCSLLVVLSIVSVYGGELYETEEYLSSTIGINPYTVNPEPVVIEDAPLSNDSLQPEEAIPLEQQTNNSIRNQSRTLRNSNNRTELPLYYFSQAIRTNVTFLRVRGRRHYAAQTQEIGKTNLGMFSALSTFSRFLRKTPDKQVAVKKVARSFKIQGTRFSVCFDLSTNGSCHDCSCAFSSITELQIPLTVFHVSV
jgi:hypothetical protein